MKINAESFTQFLNLLNLSGEVEIKECIFRGTKDKLSVVAVTPSKVVIVGAELKGDFTDIGDVGIDNVLLLKKMIASCKGEITLTKTTNKLKITSGKKLKAELALRNLQYVLNEVDKAKFDILLTKASGNEFTLDKDTLKEFEKFYSVLGKEILITGDENEITFTLENSDNSVDLTTTVTESVKKFGVKLAPLLMKVFAGIGLDKIKLSINDGASVILVNTSTDDYTINYLIAPMVK